MPIGVIADVLAVAVGGLTGVAVSRFVNENLKDGLNMVFGCCAMGMGISSIVLMQNMPAVIFSLIAGTAIGLVIHLGDLINKAAEKLQNFTSRFIRYKGDLPEAEFNSTLVTVIVLFCASGTGIYGTLLEGMIADHTVLISKAILDIFTAGIFACSLGAVVALISVPQAVIMGLLFVLAKFIEPYATDMMIADFRACGGFILLATGFRVAKIKMFPIADMIPAMVLVMPVSALWAAYILPLL